MTLSPVYQSARVLISNEIADDLRAMNEAARAWGERFDRATDEERLTMLYDWCTAPSEEESE